MFLTHFADAWSQYCEQTITIRNVFLYLDRSHSRDVGASAAAAGTAAGGASAASASPAPTAPSRSIWCVCCRSAPLALSVSYRKHREIHVFLS